MSDEQLRQLCNDVIAAEAEFHAGGDDTWFPEFAMDNCVTLARELLARLPQQTGEAVL